MSWDECELPEFFDEKEVIARKKHRCCECRTTIEPGEKYYKCAGKWDGDFSEFKQHLICLNACVSIRHFQSGECIPFGAFWEWYDEYHYSKKDWPIEMKSAIKDLLLLYRKRKTKDQKYFCSADKRNN